MLEVGVRFNSSDLGHCHAGLAVPAAVRAKRVLVQERPVADLPSIEGVDSLDRNPERALGVELILHRFEVLGLVPVPRGAGEEAVFVKRLAAEVNGCLIAELGVSAASFHIYLSSEAHRHLLLSNLGSDGGGVLEQRLVRLNSDRGSIRLLLTIEI